MMMASHRQYEIYYTIACIVYPTQLAAT